AIQRGLVEEAIQTVQVPSTDPETGEALTDIETGEPLMEEGEQPVMTDEGQQVYRLAGQDTLVMPGDPEWPKERGLRQIQFLKDKLVFDAKSAFSDIPAGR